MPCLGQEMHQDLERFGNATIKSSLAVFGNGRTHTGELFGSGGSRLANYGQGGKHFARQSNCPTNFFAFELEEIMSPHQQL